MSAPSARHAALWLLPCVLSLGCDRAAAPPSDAGPSAASSAATPSAEAAGATIAPDPPEPPRASPQDWQLAAAGDPLDLARLARIEGGGRLVAVAAKGGEYAQVALASLPHAPDAELALGPLCRAIESSPQARFQRLQAVSEALASAERSLEAIPARRTCAQSLKRLVPKLTGEELELASSALQALSPVD